MPFDDSMRIDEECVQREVEYLVDAGVDGLGIALATEVPMLTEAERERALVVFVRQACGRMKVVMNSM
jgi:dihydrodipicolinate synthase/N-acetylneuraminate lyase